MKTNKKYIIFAMLLGVMCIINTNKATAADVKGGGTIIADESEMKFASYIGSVLPDYVKIENWSIIEDVVTLYNHKPSKIRSISADKSKKFEVAISDLSKKLEGLNSVEAQQWRSDIEKTAAAIQFLRNFDINSIASDNIEIPSVKAPVSIVGL